MRVRGAAPSRNSRASGVDRTRAHRICPNGAATTGRLFEVAGVDLSQLNADQTTEVVRIAGAVGIPADLFDGWAGHEFALYQDTGGRSSSLEAAQAEAQRKAALGNWTLDLGIRAAGLPRDQGAAFRQRLEEAGIPFEGQRQTTKYIKRIHAVTAEHGDVLRELAKR